MANRAMNQFNLTFEKRMVSVFAAVMSQGQGKIPTLDNINAWDSAFTYSTGATVVYVGGVYVSLQGSNTNQNPTTATTYWALTNIPLPTPGVVAALGVGYGAALSPYPAASAYAGGTTYSAGQIVTNGGLTYVCIATTTGNAPPNTTYWLRSPPARRQHHRGVLGVPLQLHHLEQRHRLLVGNVVLYSGINYVAIATTSNTNKIPFQPADLLGSLLHRGQLPGQQGRLQREPLRCLRLAGRVVVPVRLAQPVGPGRLHPRPLHPLPGDRRDVQHVRCEHGHRGSGRPPGRWRRSVHHQRHGRRQRAVDRRLHHGDWHPGHPGCR